VSAGGFPEAPAVHEIGFGYTHDGMIQNFCEFPDCGWKGAPGVEDEVAEAAGHQAEVAAQEEQLTKRVRSVVLDIAGDSGVTDARRIEAAVSGMAASILRLKHAADGGAQ
jgi:hypothetical protein